MREGGEEEAREKGGRRKGEVRGRGREGGEEETLVLLLTCMWYVSRML